MKELIDNLLPHTNNRNIVFIHDLTDFIIENNITTLDGLKDEYDIQKLFKRVNESINKEDELNVSEYNELINLKHNFNDLEETEQIKRLIKLHALLEFELIFKYHTYNMILNDEI